MTLGLGTFYDVEVDPARADLAMARMAIAETVKELVPVAPRY